MGSTIGSTITCQGSFVGASAVSLGRRERKEESITALKSAKFISSCLEDQGSHPSERIEKLAVSVGHEVDNKRVSFQLFEQFSVSILVKTQLNTWNPVGCLFSGLNCVPKQGWFSTEHQAICSSYSIANDSLRLLARIHLFFSLQLRHL